MRDMLSFSIATYNERPDMYNLVAGRLLSEFVPPRDFWYSSHSHYQGTMYGPSRHKYELMFQWIMYRMSGIKVFSPDMEYVPYQWMYIRRPDGQEFRNGDSSTGYVIGQYLTNNTEQTFYSSNLYGNPYVKNMYTAQNPNNNPITTTQGILTPVDFLLCNDPDLVGISHTTRPDLFPLTKYFGSPYGSMVARTGWTEPRSVNLSSDIAMAHMLIGENTTVNHQHLDSGSFQLYYKGALAITSGAYRDYGSDHNRKYNSESISYNTLLIYDPNEAPSQYRVNSGGQRRPGGEQATFTSWLNSGYDMGTVLDQEYDKTSALPKYSYIKGDITRAYTNKVSEVLRSMMFMPLDDTNHPAALIVMDKVTSTNPAFKKTWLLHTIQEPTISGNTAVVKRNTNGYNGRMDLTTLLPSNFTYTKIGGPGREFEINGVNWPPSGSTLGAGAEAGAWRIELSPSTAAPTDYFLNVMQVSDSNVNATPLPTTLIETDNLAGVKLEKYVALFGKHSDRIDSNISFNIPGIETGGIQVNIAGLAEGDWNIYNGTSFIGKKTSTKSGGMISFEGGAGNYSLFFSNSDLTATLESLSYGNSGNILEIGQLEYNIVLPDSNVPTVAAEAADPMATVVITQANSVPGSAIIEVTSADMTGKNTYIINFTNAQYRDSTISQMYYTHNNQTKP